MANVVRTGGVAGALVASAVLVVPGGTAAAAAGVTLTPLATAYTNAQNVTVSGTGFPTRAQNPSGLQIIECADPGGTTGNLPMDNTTCDGTTINPLPILTDSNGNFSASYSMVQLKMSTGGVVNCDNANECVLWVGVDYINSFLGAHAFSTPFFVNSPGTTTPETPMTIALPIGAAFIVGGAVFLARRRRPVVTQ
jgi:hypothetical protein